MYCRDCIFFGEEQEYFPDVFKKRAEVERLVGHSCIKGVFLDELDPEAGREDTAILPDCGLFCELLS